MSKKTLQTVLIVLLLVVALFTIVKYAINGNRTMVNPGAKQVINEQTPESSIPSYNPPKEIKYDSKTDLQKELDSVDPQVLDEDFQELKN